MSGMHCGPALANTAHHSAVWLTLDTAMYAMRKSQGTVADVQEHAWYGPDGSTHPTWSDKRSFTCCCVPGAMRTTLMRRQCLQEVRCPRSMF